MPFVEPPTEASRNSPVNWSTVNGLYLVVPKAGRLKSPFANQSLRVRTAKHLVLFEKSRFDFFNSIHDFLKERL